MFEKAIVVCKTQLKSNVEIQSRARENMNGLQESELFGLCYKERMLQYPSSVRGTLASMTLKPVIKLLQISTYTIKQILTFMRLYQDLLAQEVNID